MIYRLRRKQSLPIKIDKVWIFFSNPKNLKKITPEYMDFKIIEVDDKKMYPGQIISYIVKPILSVPIKWMTEITHVKKNIFFVDEQKSGPYKIWHHKHYFKEIEGGTEMIDIVHYKIPFGLLGRIAHRLFVRKKLNQIFDYRSKELIKIFGKYKES